MGKQLAPQNGGPFTFSVELCRPAAPTGALYFTLNWHVPPAASILPTQLTSVAAYSAAKLPVAVYPVNAFVIVAPVKLVTVNSCVTELPGVTGPPKVAGFGEIAMPAPTSSDAVAAAGTPPASIESVPIPS